MHRIIVIALAGASLAGCSSFSGMFKSAPTTVQVQLESTPPGADAVTSVGPGCKTPCTVTVTPPENGGFSVTYNLPKFQPATVPVNVIRNPGDLTTPASSTVDPNPVAAELQPAAPPPKARKPRRKPKPAPAAAAAPEAEPASAGGSPFPDPGAPTQH